MTSTMISVTSNFNKVVMSLTDNKQRINNFTKSQHCPTNVAQPEAEP